MHRRRIAVRTLMLAAFVLCGALGAAAQNMPFLVKDINPPYAPRSFTSVGNIVFFAAGVSGHGKQLWKTDGTASGTVLVKQFAVGSDGAQQLINFNGTLFFTVDNTVWKSDGTTPGTVQLTTCAPEISCSPSYLTVSGSKLFYRGNSSEGIELWVSDGSTPQRLAYGWNGFGNSMVAFNGAVYFLLSGSSNGWHLCKSDGTLVGTVLVAMPFEPFPLFLPVSAGKIFIPQLTSDNRLGLWSSDGTFAGTLLVRNFEWPDSIFPPDVWPTDVNGTLFFLASDGVNGLRLWKSDGTPTGTVSFGPRLPGGNLTRDLTNVNGTLYFDSCNVTTNNGCELWKTNGTTAGTVLVKDICPGSCSADPRSLTAGKGALYFTANDGVAGTELWTSDGTEAGTRRVADLNPGSQGSAPLNLADGGKYLFFQATVDYYDPTLYALQLSPAITTISPATGPVAGGQSVTITGVELTGATVTIGGNPASVTGSTTSTVTFTTPAHALGAVDVTVTTAIGTTRATGGYTYVAAPTMTNIDPALGPAAGSQFVTITGTNLNGATVVIGGNTANVTGATATTATFFTPPHTPGRVDVTVTTTGGSATLTLGYRYTVDAPATITATAVSPTSIGVSWSAVVGAAGYNLARSTDGVNYAYTNFAPIPGTFFTDTNVTGGNAYLYKAQAMESDNLLGSFSLRDLATTVMFTDDPLAAGVTPVKAAHVVELRTAVNAVRVLAGLAPFAFTDSITAGDVVKANHLLELRGRLAEAQSMLIMFPPPWGESTLIPGVTTITAAHFTELRNAVK